MQTIPDELVALLDARDNRRFKSEFSSQMATNGPKWFYALLSTETSAKTFSRLHALAWFVFVERQGRHFGEPQRFVLTPLLENLQELVYKLDVFETLEVPFESWAATLAEFQNLVRQMLEDGADLKADPRSVKVQQVISTQLAAIRQSPEFEARFTDYLNGAL